jgi:hypothetical protein
MAEPCRTSLAIDAERNDVDDDEEDDAETAVA